MKFRIYLFNKHPGGEYIWLERISRKLGAELIFFWDDSGKEPILAPSGFTNHLVFFFIKILNHFSKRLARGIYSILGIYTYKIPQQEDYFTIMSSTYVPLPKSKNLIAYIHTPSRLLTIEYYKEMSNRNNISSKIAFFLWKNLYNWFYVNSMKRGKIIFSNSKNTQNRLKKYFNIDSRVIYPSVDVENFSCFTSENYFFYPSRISPQKRQMFALKAFMEFYKERKDFKLILSTTKLQSETNLKYLENVRKFITENSLNVEIKVGLKRSEILDLYSRSFACIFSGIDEDFGLVPIESMASGKPIIAVNEGGMSETITDGQTGFLVSTEKEMAEKMKYLVENFEDAKNMGIKGRKFVERNFSDEVFISKFKFEIE